MTTFYIFRHGQTDFNVKHVIQGQKFDPSLNVNGMQQAEQLAIKLKDIKFDLFLSSTQKRAIETIQIVNKYHNVEIFYDEALQEGSFGKAEGMTEEKAAEVYSDIYKKWQTMSYPDICFPGGETPNEIADRVLKVLRYWANRDVLTVAVATHSDVIYAMLMRLKMKKISINNGDFIVLEHKGNNFFIK